MKYATLFVAMVLLTACKTKEFFVMPDGSLSKYIKTEPGVDGVQPRASYIFHKRDGEITVARRTQGDNVKLVDMDKDGVSGMPTVRCVCTSAEHECEFEWDKKSFVCKGCGDETHTCKIQVGIWGRK